MDITAIFDYLNGSQHDNTVLVMSNTLYENVQYIKTELPGVRLMYEPLSIYHQDFMELLTTVGLSIKCSNQELLDNLHAKQNILIGSENLTHSFIKSALQQGHHQYTVANRSDVARITDAAASNSAKLALTIEVSDNVEKMLEECPSFEPISILFKKELVTALDVQCIGSRIHSLLEMAKLYGRDIREISIGLVDNVGVINSLKDSIRVLNETLPGDITLTIELAQEIVESAVIVATKITGKSLQEGTTEYEVDMSMFGELAGYTELSENSFNILTEENSGILNPSKILGNTGDKEDVIFMGCLEDLTEDGWILIVNAGMADCRDFDIVLLDKNFRTLKAVKPMHSQNNAIGSTDGIRRSVSVTA